MARGRESRLAALLVNAGLISKQQMAQAVAEHARRGGALPLILTEMGFATGPAIARTIAAATHHPLVELGPRFLCDPQARGMVDPQLALSELVVPYALRDKGATLWLAMADPTDEETANKVAQSSMRRVKPVVAACDDIRDAVLNLYGLGGRRAEAIELDGESGADEPMVITDIASDITIKEVRHEEREASAGGAGPTTGEWAAIVPPLTGQTPSAPLASFSDLTPDELERLKQLRASQREASKILKAVLQLCVEKGVFPLEEFKRRTREQ